MPFAARPVAATAHGGQRSADGGVDLDREGKRVPSATKISPAVIWIIIRWRNHAVAEFQRSRGRVRRCGFSSIQSPRQRNRTTRRFQEAFCVSEIAYRRTNDSVLGVRGGIQEGLGAASSVNAVRVLRDFSGALRAPSAAGVSTDASAGLTSKKNTAFAPRCEVCGARLSKIQLWDLSQ